MRRQTAAQALLAGLVFFLTSASLAEITLYKDDNYHGDSRHLRSGASNNIKNEGFNDAASSIVIDGDTAWEVCTDANFGGRCETLEPGKYPSLRRMDLNDSISSVREVSRGDASQGSGAATVRCESHDGGRHECEMNTRGEVVMSRQLSHSACVEGESWGLQRHTVWVDRGCRAEFTNRSMQSNGSARDSGPPSAAIRACNAVNDRYGTVDTYTALQPGWWEVILKYDDGKYVCNVNDDGRVEQFERLRR